MSDVNVELDIDLDNLVLTTRDNPHNPKEDYLKWKRWDQEQGYNTEEYIGRLVLMEGIDDIDDELVLNNAIEKVINDILENDSTETYMLV